MVNKKKNKINLTNEVKRLTLKLEKKERKISILQKSSSNYYAEVLKLQNIDKNKDKDKEMFRKAFSVCLAAVDEKRLAWSLANAFDRQKLSFELNQDVHTFAENNFDAIKEELKQKDKKTSKIGLLDSVLNEFLGNKEK